jgi:hypothetical protein
MSRMFSFRGDRSKGRELRRMLLLTNSHSSSALR